MLNEQDANVASESSAEVASTTDVSAESSTAESSSQGEQAPKSLAEAISNALNEGKSEPPADEQEEKTEGEQPTEEQADEKLPFNQHPRFKELIAQKNEFKAQAEELTQAVEQFKGKAEQFDSITSYMEQHRLQPQEVQEGFKLMAMLKNNPAQFAQAIAPYLQQAQQFTGEILPADLQGEVDGGYMTMERARELASLRVNSQFQSQNMQERLAAERQAREQETLLRTVEANRSAVNSLEAQWMATDPDYGKKQQFIMTELRLLALESPPKSPAEATKLAEKAKANVEDRLRGMLPRKAPVSTTPQGRSAGTTPTKKPTSLREAVELGLAQTE